MQVVGLVYWMLPNASSTVELGYIELRKADPGVWACSRSMVNKPSNRGYRGRGRRSSTNGHLSYSISAVLDYLVPVSVIILVSII